ncbi:hypothetical protein EPN96_04865 [bacterium]|nr:MAG: hypothetical protein EPN96_04865 [bacterium]
MRPKLLAAAVLVFFATFFAPFQKADARMNVVVYPAWGCMGDPTGMYLGLGLVGGRVASDSLTYESEGVSGFDFTLGYRFVEQFSFDLSIVGANEYLPVKPTSNIYYPGDSAEFSVLYLGVKADLFPMSETGWTPWLGFGFAFPFLSWRNYWYSQDGSAPYLAVGLDQELGRGFFLRGRYSAFRSGMTDFYGYESPDLTFSAFSLSIMYEFGRGQWEE